MGQVQGMFKVEGKEAVGRSKRGRESRVGRKVWKAVAWNTEKPSLTWANSLCAQRGWGHTVMWKLCLPAYLIKNTLYVSEKYSKPLKVSQMDCTIKTRIVNLLI